MIQINYIKFLCVTREYLKTTSMGRGVLDNRVQKKGRIGSNESPMKRLKHNTFTSPPPGSGFKNFKTVNYCTFFIVITIVNYLYIIAHIYSDH